MAPLPSSIGAVRGERGADGVLWGEGGGVGRCQLTLLSSSIGAVRDEINQLLFPLCCCLWLLLFALCCCLWLLLFPLCCCLWLLLFPPCFCLWLLLFPLSCCLWLLLFPLCDRLIGLVVRRPPRKWKIPGSIPLAPGFFLGQVIPVT